uniref:Nuclear pore complex protein NUP43 n=1 Tax=Ananas comosus var. bracteatus TaxID=296719 RepID=A0A6V7QAW9_ANACO|nr:unnamed protein product [Ananas comosus var. bracteatus]
MAEPGDLRLHRYPQSKSVDAVRWLPSASAFGRLVAVAVHDPDADPAAASALEIHSLSPTQATSPLCLRSSWPSPPASPRSAPPTSPTTPRRRRRRIHPRRLLPPAPRRPRQWRRRHRTLDLRRPVVPRGAGDGAGHANRRRRVRHGGEDGRVNVVGAGEGRMEHRRVHDSNGLASYTAARWGSPAEFATGGVGFGVRWWDQRKPEGLVAQFKGSWGGGGITGMVHSIDIHPSRKHICIVGGSSGTVFAWDLRWQQQPILLSGVGLNGTDQPVFESEVWEVQYDSYTQSSGITSAPSTKILPVMVCSEDGILAVLEQGEDPVELLAEPCAINAFDIDPQNPSDVVCALEWESMAILSRGRDVVAIQ